MGTLWFKATTSWKVADDSALSQTQANLTTSKIESSDISEHVVRDVSIPDGTTDQAIGFTGADGMTEARALFLTTNQPIMIKINGGSAIPVGRTADEDATFLLDATTISSLSVSNASGKTANLRLSLPGA